MKLKLLGLSRGRNEVRSDRPRYVSSLQRDVQRYTGWTEDNVRSDYRASKSVHTIMTLGYMEYCDGVLVLTRPSEGAAEAMKTLEETLQRTTARRNLESAADRAGTVTYQYVFSGLKVPVAEFQEALTKAGGLTSVNVFLDRPGGIR